MVYAESKIGLNGMKKERRNTQTSVVARWLLPSSQSVLGSCTIHSSSLVFCFVKRPISKLPMYCGSSSSWNDSSVYDHERRNANDVRAIIYQ